MRVKRINPCLILLVAALPLASSLLAILLSSAGHVDELSMQLSLYPLQISLFAIGFALLVLVRQGHSTTRLASSTFLFLLALVFTNAAISGGSHLLGMILVQRTRNWGFIMLDSVICLPAYGIFMARFLGVPLQKNSYIRLFLFGLILSPMNQLAMAIFPLSLAFELSNSSWYLAAGLALYYESIVTQEAALPEQKQVFSPGIPLKFGIGLAFIPPFLIACGVTASLITSFDGYCYGFTDGKWGCSLWDFLMIQFGYALMFFSMPFIGWVGFILLMTRFKNVLRQGRQTL